MLVQGGDRALHTEALVIVPGVAPTLAVKYTGAVTALLLKYDAAETAPLVK